MHWFRRVLYYTRDYWGSGLGQRSNILKEYYISETGSVSVLRWKGGCHLHCWVHYKNHISILAQWPRSPISNGPSWVGTSSPFYLMAWIDTVSKPFVFLQNIGRWIKSISLVISNITIYSYVYITNRKFYWKLQERYSISNRTRVTVHSIWDVPAILTSVTMRSPDPFSWSSLPSCWCCLRIKLLFHVHHPAFDLETK
jgi:hypothetical protein